MNRLFWGLLLCLLDYEITVGSAVFGLLPDFLGYFLMMKGMEELAGESRFFDRGRHVAFGMVIVSLILYVADLMDPGNMARAVLWTVELAGLMVQLVLVRMIVLALAQMERTHGLALHSELLKSMWTILIVVYPLAQLISWLPVVGDVCAMAALVVGVLFLMIFWDSRKTFQNTGK